MQNTKNNDTGAEKLFFIINLLFLQSEYISGHVNMKKNYEIKVYTKSDELPPLLAGNFFHSLELFEISEGVSGDTPFMAVATEDGRTIAQMLAVLHTHRTWFPPFIYTHAHAHGEGIYLSAEQKKNSSRSFSTPLPANFAVTTAST